MSMREDGEFLVLGDLAAVSVERDDAGDVAMCYTEEMEEIMEKINNPTQLASVRADFDKLLAFGGGQETDAGIWRFLDRHAFSSALAARHVAGIESFEQHLAAHVLKLHQMGIPKASTIQSQII